MKKLRLLLADDHAVVREGLKRIIGTDRRCEVVGEATNGREVLTLVNKLRPAVLVMDISMPELNATQMTKILTQKMPDLLVLILTVHEDRSYLCALLEAGARGYVLKRTAGDELIRAIHTVAGGDTYVDPRVAGKMVQPFAPPRGSAVAPTRKLTERESSVLCLIARGYSNKEIGHRLNISVKTVETHKARSMEKLGLRSRVDVVRYAHSLGWLGESEPAFAAN